MVLRLIQALTAISQYLWEQRSYIDAWPHSVHIAWNRWASKFRHYLEMYSRAKYKDPAHDKLDSSGSDMVYIPDEDDESKEEGKTNGKWKGKTRNNSE